MTDVNDLFELAKATRDIMMNGFLGQVERRYAEEAAQRYTAHDAKMMIEGGKFGIHLSVLMQTFIAQQMRMRNGAASQSETDQIVHSIAYAVAHMLVNLSSNFKPIDADNRQSLQRWMERIAPICVEMIASVDAGQAEGMRLDDKGDGKMHATPFAGELPNSKTMTKH